MTHVRAPSGTTLINAQCKGVETRDALVEQINAAYQNGGTASGIDLAVDLIGHGQWDSNYSDGGYKTCGGPQQRW